MKSQRLANVESINDRHVRRINDLEIQIERAEDSADAMLWEQAKRVVDQLAVGLSRRQLASRWINGRTHKPYSEKHLRIVERVWRE